MAYNKELGKVGEEIARKYLESNGYKIIEKNFRCKLGEIDIIGKEGDYLVFIEVKTRRSNVYGYPVEAINKKKQNSLMKVAQTYIAFKKIKNINLRFDVVEVILNNENKEIRVIKNAFGK